MARTRIPKHPWTDLAGAPGEIVRTLTQVARGSHRCLPEVVSDWIAVVQATLAAQPRQVTHLQGHPTLVGYADDAPTQALWARLGRQYPRDAWE